jgi:membrane complex biogenesis BtpA family protein
VTELFDTDRALIGMVHVAALPGTPLHSRPVSAIVEQAVEEARLLAEAGFDGILLENMHDRPYLRQEVGPEIISAMAAVVDGVRGSVSVPLGVQILAGANRQALAVALAGRAAFIRAENFTFAHVADEGLMAEADAARLMRYRRELGAEHIRVFADIKKKHASHALTADVDIAETAQAAAFFGADALVVTGNATGRPASLADVRAVGAAVELPLVIGSGVTPDHLAEWWPLADAFIVGSFIKRDGQWFRPPDPDRIGALMGLARELRKSSG